MQSQQSEPKAVHVLSVSAMHCVSAWPTGSISPFTASSPSHGAICNSVGRDAIWKTCEDMLRVYIRKRHVNLWGLFLPEPEAGKHYQGEEEYGLEGCMTLAIW